MYAACRGHAEVVRRLEMAGADLNEKDDEGNTPLLLAPFSGSTETVRARIDLGGHEYVSVRGNNGNTPLHNAAFYNQPEIAQYLVEKGAELDIQNEKGITAIHTAISRANIEGTRTLVALGANLSITATMSTESQRDMLPLCPLSYATKNGWAVIVEYLLSQ